MITRRAVQRKAMAKPPMPLTLQERARRLPMFGPGIVITVALPLLPAYMDLYQLVPMTRLEISKLEEHGMHRPDGVLWVKRVPKVKGGDALPHS